eukprot:11708633-Prorocentrum_lima.AAC.1
MTSSLVGSEMCIRDRGFGDAPDQLPGLLENTPHAQAALGRTSCRAAPKLCLLYKSDAADDM